MKYIRIYAAVLGILFLLLGGAFLHAWVKEGIPLNRLRAARSFLPSGDPGMNTSARYIRHLALSYPGSPFPDFPGQSDYLPAGMAWAPPHFPGVRTRIELEAPAFEGNP